MATVIDVSSRLGEYMLKGWVLTDRICPKCNRVPMMRSPSAAAIATEFCVNCDSGPDSVGAAQSSRPQHMPSLESPAPDTSSVSTVSYSTHLSRSSTPPTDVSDAPDSPLLLPIMDTAELLRRRQQSDAASAEIGKRMLRGWAMLADECPNPNCYGIPLVRPPKVQTINDPGKECVICGTVYIDEKDLLGQDRLVPRQALSSPADTYRQAGPAPAGPSSVSHVSADKGKARARDVEIPPPNDGWCNSTQAHSESHVNPMSTIPAPTPSTVSALEVSARSLERSLLALSARLDSLSSGTIVDPMPIGVTADTVAKVSQALTQVKQLLWSGGQARIA
ncbi:hypothetical protein BN946_scf185043.g125 [Trametes cinnabarina]|uniref:Uncharacterized protein n=1 Tax=Pycnoporus cinnabarinus TaxID=5643 RepID=A0A060SI32_PYCCI|nr:hypothetical protein BN946_scf185043.g125 [Trametes cinnabarina]